MKVQGRDIDVLSPLSLVVRGGVSVGLLWFVISSIGFEAILSNLSQLNFTYTIIALTLSILGVVLSAWKWKILLEATGKSISTASAITYYYIGQFYNTFLPSIIGGDGARMYYLSSDTGQPIESASSIATERVVGLYSILFIVGGGLIIGKDSLPPVLPTEAILIGILGIFLASIVGVSFPVESLLNLTVFRISLLDVGNVAKEFYLVLHDLKEKKSIILVALVISIIFRFFLILANYCIGLGLGIDVSLVTYFVVIPAIELLLFLPISIQGFGVRETAYLYVFSSVGVAPSVAISFGFIMQIILRVLNNVIGGIVYSLYMIAGDH